MKIKKELPLPLPWRLCSSAGGGGGGGSYRLKALVWIVLVCCSPVLIPLIFLSFPLIFVIFLCLRFDRESEGIEIEEEKPRKTKAGDSGALLHRYLEDQLKLVLGSIDDDDDDDRLSI